MVESPRFEIVKNSTNRTLGVRCSRGMFKGISSIAKMYGLFAFTVTASDLNAPPLLTVKMACRAYFRNGSW
jgi:hypothetical protein